jgi:hypothetical protein
MEASTAETLTAIGALIAATAALGQLAVIALAAWYAKKQVDEARESREERSRPFVVIDFDVEHARPLIRLVVTNNGPTIAHDVRFQFDPPLRSTFDGEWKDSPPIAALKIFSQGIPSLAPGKQIATLYESFFNFDKPNAAPRSYNVTTSYVDHAGRPYTERTVLDLDVYWNTRRVERHGVHDVHERLKEISKEIKNWTAGLNGGIRIATDADLQRRHERHMQAIEERRRAQDATEQADPDGAT